MVANGNGNNGKKPKAKAIKKKINKASNNGGGMNSSSVNQNSIVARSIMTPLQMPAGNSALFSTGVPNMGNLGNGAMRVRHREFVTDILGIISTPTFSFQIGTLSVNPGISSTFPWLSTVASRFEKYQFNKLVFNYMPSCSVTTVGTVLAAFDTDAADTAPPTKVQLMSYQNASRSPCWGAFVNHLPKVGDGFRYVRRSGNPAGTDIKTYDVANYFVGVSGTAAATQVGELYVEYDVTLMVPQIVETLSSAAIISAATNPALPFAAVNFNATGDLAVGPHPTDFRQVCVYAPVGSSFLVACDMANGTGLTAVDLATTTTGGSNISFLGVTSSCVTGTDATFVNAFVINAVTTGQVGANAILNGSAQFRFNSTAGTITAGGVTVSLSPWQGGLAFP